MVVASNTNFSIKTISGKNDIMTLKEQGAKEEEKTVGDRRKGTYRRVSAEVDYLLLNFDIPDRRSGEDRRAE